MLEILLYIVIAIAFFSTIARLVQRIYKFPIPHFLIPLIDNPIRLLLQPPEKTIKRHNIRKGMNVLEIGPGRGSYTLAAAKVIGEGGRITAVDVQPQVVARLEKKVLGRGIRNLEVKVADAQKLPFKNRSFDLIFMIGVIGEIPNMEKAVKEFHRVLKSNGELVISEIIPDPHYSRADVLVNKITSMDFKLNKKVGNFVYYTLIFNKT